MRAMMCACVRECVCVCTCMRVHAYTHNPHAELQALSPTPTLTLTLTVHVCVRARMSNDISFKFKNLPTLLSHRNSYSCPEDGGVIMILLKNIMNGDSLPKHPWNKGLCIQEASTILACRHGK